VARPSKGNRVNIPEPVRGSIFTNTVEAEDVGNLVAISIKSEGNKPYQCRDITIIDGYKSWVFQCDEPVQCPNDCRRDYMIRGS
jgi:hypothetical protein